MTDFTKALSDPSAIYRYPDEVIGDNSLNKDQKTKILHQWEYDARELLVADEENMAGEGGSMLQRILEALHQIDPQYDSTHSASTKQGGGEID
jgi:hypothetical protein